MTTLSFWQVDVFTTQPLSGNPLAVFPDAAGLSTETMQAIAREMNLSETTFVSPPEAPGADARVRIFTPGEELPMAGHPTLGTAFTLWRQGAAPAEGGTLHLELGVGVLPVELSPERVTMTQATPHFGPPLEAEALARLAGALGLDPEAAWREGPQPQAVSAGLPHLMVPLPSLAALEGAQPDLAAAAPLLRALGADGLYLHALPEDPAQPLRARLFAPGVGVAEDPGTGSAAGPLGLYLVAKGLRPPGPLEILQGLELRRPCQIFVHIDRDAQGQLAPPKVGGAVVKVIEGQLRC